MNRTLATLALVSVVAMPSTGCGSETPTAGGTSAPVTQTGLDGVYRYEVSEEYLVAGGIPEGQAKLDAGITTVTIRGGVYSEQWSNAALGDKTCVGTLAAEGPRISVRWTPGGGCDGSWSMTATSTGDQITWSDVEPARTGAFNDYAVYYAKPWTRIGDAP
jgi:hypothetical protein